MIKHLIFDFDGTISDSYPHFMDIFRYFAQDRGWDLPYDDEQLLRELLVSVKATHKKLGWDQHISYDDFWKEFSAIQLRKANQFRAFPAAIDLLRYATERGITCYVYTHSGKAVPEHILPNMGIAEYIKFTIDKTMGFADKPNPEALLFLMDRFGLKPEECMMIGDRPIDAKCGMNAGMKGCLWDFYGIFCDAPCDIYVRGLEEIKNHL